MFLFSVRAAFVALSVWVLAGASAVASETVKTFEPRDGAAFDVLVMKADETDTAVILFTGGKGLVKLNKIHKNKNFGSSTHRMDSKKRCRA